MGRITHYTEEAGVLCRSAKNFGKLQVTKMHCWYLENKFKYVMLPLGKDRSRVDGTLFPVAPRVAEDVGGRM